MAPPLHVLLLHVPRRSNLRKQSKQSQDEISQEKQKAQHATAHGPTRQTRVPDGSATIASSGSGLAEAAEAARARAALTWGACSELAFNFCLRFEGGIQTTKTLPAHVQTIS